MSLKNQLNNVLNKAIKDAGKIGLESLSSDNRMANMVSGGSKGKSINIAQMVACLGQQNVDGKRIPVGTMNVHFHILPNTMFHQKHVVLLKIHL